MTEITVIVLTRDEARHITRCIASTRTFATRVIVVDSGSTDATIALARAAGAQVLNHSWTNHADQFNWALDQIKGTQGWVLRLDADEMVTPQLTQIIKEGLPDVQGLYVDRQIKFMGQLVRYGGVNPVQTLRLFRYGAGRCEARWMDEHIVVDGVTARLRGTIVDDNLNPLDWWVAKHNAYASREVMDVLARRYGFAGHTPAPRTVKRWVKTHLYQHLPAGVRAAAYFFYRFVLRLGVLDGRQARQFHVLQGFWYRYLVDAKLAEVERYITQHNASPQAAITAVLGVDLPILKEIAA